MCFDGVKKPRIGRYGGMPNEAKVFGETPSICTSSGAMLTIAMASRGTPSESVVCGGSSTTAASIVGRWRRIERTARCRPLVGVAIEA